MVFYTHIEIEKYGFIKASEPNPKKYRVFIIVSRQVLIDSCFFTMICAPIYSSFDALSTQVPVGIDDELKHDSSIHCDEPISIPKSSLSRFTGILRPLKIQAFNQALTIALGLDSPF